MLYFFVLVIFGGILFRLRGIKFSWIGTQGNRLIFWSVPVGVILTVLHPVYGWWNAPYLIGLIAALWLGLAIGGWDKPTMGFLAETARGALVTIFAGALLYISNPWVGCAFALSGLFVGTAWEIDDYFSTIKGVIDKGHEWGEFLIGCFILASGAFTLLN